VSDPAGVQAVTSLTVTVAALHGLDDARWAEAALRSLVAPGDLLDVAIIERTLDEVTAFHCSANAAWGGGVLASAVCGALWPPCLVVGALAGSVGGRVMTAMRRGLTLRAIATLSGLLEFGTFFVVMVSDGRLESTPSMPRGRPCRIETVPVRLDAATLREALDADLADV
jgi:hypothetical protein